MKLELDIAQEGDEMRGRTIAVRVTGGDMVELYITREDSKRAIVRVSPGSFFSAV